MNCNSTVAVTLKHHSLTTLHYTHRYLLLLEKAP